MALTYLITGAGRGLGLELARQLTTRGDAVIGTVRDPAKACDAAKRVRGLVPLDVADEASINALGRWLDGVSVDVLINNAGVYSETGKLEGLTMAALEQVLRVNSIAPVLVTKAVLPNLRAGKRKLIFNITSQLGSITNNTGGSTYGYRVSKAALNMLTVSMAVELRGEGFTCVVAHPGWVRTDMGGPQATLAPEESARALIALMDRLTPAETGRFFSYDGMPLPW